MKNHSHHQQTSLETAANRKYKALISTVQQITQLLKALTNKQLAPKQHLGTSYVLSNIYTTSRLMHQQCTLTSAKTCRTVPSVSLIFTQLEN